MKLACGKSPGDKRGWGRTYAGKWLGGKIEKEGSGTRIERKGKELTPQRR